MKTFDPTIKFKRVNPDAPDPKYAHDGDAAVDLYSMESVIVYPFETKMVGSGIAVSLPDYMYGDIRPRSGMASKRGITLANAPATIDSGYRGEIILPLYNMTTDPVEIEKGERVCQMIIGIHAKATFMEVEDLDESERGANGLGSSGYERL